MDRLWAPWRIGYVKTKRREKGCLFCRAKKSINKYRVFLKTRHSFSMLNIYPYNNGHVMVVPSRHVRDIAGLTDQEALDLIKALNKTKLLLDRALRPQGYNIGINISQSAGAGIVGHLHIHIVPRWRGDTNFMPTVFNAKVILQSLDELYRQLKDAHEKSD
jgi:ATP adenylyltransferase